MPATVPRYGARALRFLVVTAMLIGFVAVPGVAQAWTTTSEVEPNGTPAQATPVLADASICEAAISPAGDEDYYAFTLEAGKTYILETGPSTSSLSVNYDIVMWLYDTDGVSELYYDDDGGAMNYSYIEYTAAATGTYYTKVRAFSHGGTTGVYGFRVREAAAPAGTSAIEGTVTSAESSPLAGVEVTDFYGDPWFMQVDPNYVTQGTTAVTAADGTYHLDAAEGGHIVEFYDPSGDYFTQYWDSQPDFESANSFELAADETTTGIDAVLELKPPLDTRVLDTMRVNTDAEGAQTEDYGSRTPDISADGEHVVFYTGAALVPEDDTEYRDWYTKDLTTGEIELVSQATDGTLSNDDDSEGEGRASISGDGRYIAFSSPADSLVEGDTNGYHDIFVRDTEEDTTVRISMGIESETNDGSYNPSISADGRYVAYSSTATNIVADDTNDASDIFVYDMETGDTELVSLDPDGLPFTVYSDDPDMSDNGNAVVFRNSAGEGAGAVWVRDLEADTTTLASVDPLGDPAEGDSYDKPVISGDGRYVAFEWYGDNLVEGDTNGEDDIFRRDMVEGVTEIVSVSSTGGQHDCCVDDPSISADGRFVAFSVDNDMLVSGDVNGYDDVVVHDMVDASTRMVSCSTSHAAGDEDSVYPSLSADGSVCAYDSWAETLVLDDTNQHRDVFATHLAKALATPLEGPWRYQTAIDVSQQNWPEGSGAVVIATGTNWPDALGGSALAGQVGAPVLLTPTDELLPEVAAEIERLGAQQIFVLGENKAISDDVFAELEGMVDPQVGEVVRLGGVDRYDTARIVAAYLVDLLGDSYDGTAFVATGQNFSDALAASPVAACMKWPVYLAPQPVIAPETITAMQDAGVTDVILLGGDAAMPEDTNVVILEAGFTALRIDGIDRYETAAKVAGFGVDECGMKWDGVGIATGVKFPDALSGGAALGPQGSVMLLTSPTTLSPYAADAVETNKDSIANVTFLGGLSALPQAVRDAIMELVQ